MKNTHTSRFMKSNTKVILYHGSNQAVYQPRINKNVFTTDFGNGFYVTANRSQAEKWAKRKARYSGQPTLNRYVFDADQPDLKILVYQADIDWIKFVIQNRMNNIKDNSDIVIGPTADGKLFSVVNCWKHGNLDLDEALLKLKPSVYSEQYCFKTERALKDLTLIDKELVR